MSVETEFDDMVKICQFYSEDDLPIEVDEENYYITLGGYVVAPVMEDVDLVMYLVKSPDGDTLFVSDLDEYFQKRLDGWEDRF